MWFSHAQASGSRSLTTTKLLTILAGQRQSEAAMSASGTRTCSWCGKLGHDKRSCDTSPNAGECSVCGYHGHDKRNCPRK